MEKNKQLELLNSAHDAISKLKAPPSLELPKLDSKSWKVWKFKLEMSLEWYKLNCLIDGSLDESVHNDVKYKELDRLVKKMILTTLDATDLEMYCDVESSIKLVGQLQNKFAGNESARMINCIKEWLDSLQHFKSVDTLILKLREVRKTIVEVASKQDPDHIWKAFFLATLPPNYSNLRTNLASNATLTLEQYFDAAIQEERFRSNNRPRENRNPMLSNLNRVQQLGRGVGLIFNSQNTGCGFCDGPHKADSCPLLKSRLSNSQRSQGNHNNGHNKFNNRSRSNFQNKRPDNRNNSNNYNQNNLSNSKSLHYNH